jgi:hypothetical protein
LTALLELSFADHGKLKEEGRNFDCSTCEVRIQKLRRCHEDREDFTFEADKGPWPMYVNKGGELYGFCPAKSTWDQSVVSLFRLLSLAAETGVMLERGGLNDQPAWFIEQASWFVPRYHDYKFNSRMIRVMGSVNGKGVISNGSNRRPNRKGAG